MQYPERPGVGEIITYLGEHPQQPKRAIAQTIAQYGIPIPHIFDDLDDALASGEAFIARSEHPAELYHSGLCYSTAIDLTGSDTDYTVERLGMLRQQQAALDNPDRSYDTLTHRDAPGRRGYLQAEWWRYLAEPDAGLHSESSDDFARQHSLSYWQMEPGYNRYIIEDSGRPGRYYIGTMRDGHREPFDQADRSVEIVEDGTITQSFYATTDPESAAQIPEPDKLIAFYQSVRALPPFDPTNAPLIEFVDRPGEAPVFVQYHPTQAMHSLTQQAVTPLTSSAIQHVRGTTDGETREFTLRTRRADLRGPIADTGFIPHGLSSFDISSSTSEYYLPQAVAYLGYGTNSDHDQGVGRYISATLDHGTRSSLFKPEVSLIVAEECLDRLAQIGRHTGGTCEAALISDGEHARLQYFDPDERKIIEI